MNSISPPEDDFGPDPIDRGSGKQMGPSQGGGSDIDPSYEDALRILGREHLIPSPFVQRALYMDDEEAARLARHLSELRWAYGAGSLSLGEAAPALARGVGDMGETVEQFVTALQETPADSEKLARLRGILEGAEGEARQALALLYEFPAIRAKLAPDEPED
jgi:hypothetical protein